MDTASTLLLSPTVGETYQACVKLNRPVVITGVLAIFPNLAKWDIDYVRKIINNKKVLVAKQSVGKEFGVWDQVSTTTAEYFKRLAEGFKDEPLQYMAQQDIDATHPELKDLIGIDQLLPKQVVRHRALWIGPGGTRVRLHMDPEDNFFLQVMGSKTFHLFSPQDTPNLYAHSPFSKSPELSQVVACNIDFNAHPKARNTRPIKVELTAGDLLFLPAYWWHEVVNSPKPSISINIWCRTKFPGNLHGMKQLMPKSIKLWLSSTIKKIVSKKST